MNIYDCFCFKLPNTDYWWGNDEQVVTNHHAYSIFFRYVSLYYKYFKDTSLAFFVLYGICVVVKYY